MKFPFSHCFNAFRHAPVGRRFQVVWKLWGTLANPPAIAPGESVDVGEIRSVEEFATRYAMLATLLGHAGKTPPPGEQGFLRAMEQLDDVRYPGGIGARDFFFLTALVSILAPRRVIEIGTLTGFSAAMIAAAIHRQHGNSGEISVETIDALTHCVIDETRPIGFEISELIPDLASTVRVHTGRKSDFARELGASGTFGLGFVDADHRHPWPLLDVLRLAPYVQSEGWIVLHDIQLGTYGKTLREAGQAPEGETPYGAEWLFERWPFQRIRSAHIGAVRLPSHKAALVPFALTLMEEPFEVEVKAAKRARRALYQSFAGLM